MDEEIKNGFVLYVINKTGRFPYEFKDDKEFDKLGELIVGYAHESEVILKDKYGVCEKDPDEYMKRKTNLSSVYGSTVTEDTEDDD